MASYRAIRQAALWMADHEYDLSLPVAEFVYVSISTQKLTAKQTKGIALPWCSATRKVSSLHERIWSLPLAIEGHRLCAVEYSESAEPLLSHKKSTTGGRDNIAEQTSAVRPPLCAGV